MAELERIAVIGGGPAGLTAAILLRRALPRARIAVHERNRAGDTFGFGVVFSAGALDFLAADAPAVHALVTPHMERWADMTLNLPDGQVVLDGIGFAAIGRLALLRILQGEAEAAGIELRYESEVADPDAFEADLLIGADGLGSRVRALDPAGFGERLELFTNRFAWFGTPRPYPTLTQSFVATPHGPLNAHHYRYAPDASTFIVECDAAGFAAHGFAAMDEQASARTCEALFAEVLEGAPLVTNRSLWRRFPRLWCERWTLGRRALIGDAAHTAHFSVGSGTRLAMEDAIALVRAVRDEPDLATALERYQSERPPIARRIVEAADRSALWYEEFASHMRQPPLDFALAYIQRSGRVDRERLRAISPGFVARLEQAA